MKTEQLTPKEKAKELMSKFNEIHTLNNYEAKQCASIEVDEILKSKKQNIIHFYRCGDEFCECGGYWQEVKSEIERL
jgi:hypothetical protein